MEEFTKKKLAGVPPKLTSVAPSRLVPWIEMELKVAPLEGVIEVITGD